MPHEPVEALAERLLVLTLALTQSDDPESLTALLTERERTLSELSEMHGSPRLAEKLAQVLRAERAALQHFAEVRAQSVRELARKSNERRASQIYGQGHTGQRLFDASN